MTLIVLLQVYYNTALDIPQQEDVEQPLLASNGFDILI